MAFYDFESSQIFLSIIANRG